MENGKPLIIGCVYSPNEGSVCNITRNDYFDVLQEDLCELKDPFSIVLEGNFNARTRDELD